VVPPICTRFFQNREAPDFSKTFILQTPNTNSNASDYGIGATLTRNTERA